MYSASGSTVDLGIGSNIITSGDKAYAIYSTGSKDRSLLKAAGINVIMQVTAGHGVYAANGNSKVYLLGMNAVKISGEGAFGVVSSKERSLIDVDETIEITTSGDKAAGGAIATVGKINLGQDSVIITRGNNAFGFQLKMGWLMPTISP
ncbi:MAG: hypothetical protein RR962_03315 [Hafnia sp.]